MAMASRMTTSCREEVYVAAMPLRASKGPAKLVFSTAYSLNFWAFHHFIVIIKPNSNSNSNSRGAVVYDFQPSDPENIWVALAALSGRKVAGNLPLHLYSNLLPSFLSSTENAFAGAILERKLQQLPTRKCWFVGCAKEDATDAASKFNINWDTHLRIGRHDCRNYTQGLVECLTGKQLVLDHLRHLFPYYYSKDEQVI